MSRSKSPSTRASLLLYEDDGASFNYRKGEWMGIRMAWNDSRRALTVKLGGSTRTAVFEGRPLEIRMTGH